MSRSQGCSYPESPKNKKKTPSAPFVVVRRTKQRAIALLGDQISRSLGIQLHPQLLLIFYYIISASSSIQSFPPSREQIIGQNFLVHPTSDPVPLTRNRLFVVSDNLFLIEASFYQNGLHYS